MPDETEPTHCQYHLCTEPPDAALDFYFGPRWYCVEHYTHLTEIWSQTDGPDPYRG
jgi:hypothetical protein